MAHPALVGLLASIIAVPAVAETPMVSIVVKSSDFASPDARAKLDRRVTAAIEDLCRTYTALEFYQAHDVTDCRRSARAQIESRLAPIRAAQRP